MKRNDAQYHYDLRIYQWGLGLALLLTAIPFALVAFHGAPPSVLLWMIGVLGLIQVIVHFRFFLHIDLSSQKREDLHLILFTVLLLVIMAGGTIWIMHNLAERMMAS
ncbi:cytochrome o ubiquinol oxidase subunit IV [Halothiobacillus sp.]|jgi:cytochrome o ubiquinol oxidase operon protein cyoD|uniref:cytochrome o ubiquinol oxidase subunit IV n=1 Tax=Halothiobacillus sp. TaxID=1891311 RepID=UPI002AD5AE56|nr:cytochrome o ubiquinol oxidase subunit IV [Halothiobacillus sp.]